MSFNTDFNNGAYTVTVSTKELGVKAAEIKEICNEIISHLQAVEKTAASIEYYWLSDGAQLAARLFNSEKKRCSDVKEELLRRVSQLDMIISLYDKNETEVKSLSEALPNSIIE